MAKSETAAAAVTVSPAEWKRELRRLVRVITEEDDARAETFDRAIAALEGLRVITNGGNSTNGKKGSQLSAYNSKKRSGRIEKVEIPEFFLCPISLEIMRDPVLLSSGQTCDRRFIQERLNSGNRTCPKTQQVLSNLTLMPNHLVHSMIAQWCSEHGITLPPVGNQDEGVVTGGERDLFKKLLHQISHPLSIPEGKQAMSDLRLLTKQNRAVRALLGEIPDAIAQLLSVLSVPDLNDDPEVQEDTVTTILNLSIHDENKKIVGDNSQAIPLLIEALKTGTMQTRSNSAAALFTLSALDSNKIKIYELGAMKPLLDLLEQGNPAAKKDAASAIFNLCMAHGNKELAVSEGAVGRVLKTIMDHSLIDESLSILALLSSDVDAVDEISQNGGVPCLLRIIKKDSCARNKENAAVILFSICMNDRMMLREVGDEETLNGTISQLAQNGTSRARRKANGILERLKRMTHATHHSC